MNSFAALDIESTSSVSGTTTPTGTVSGSTTSSTVEWTQPSEPVPSTVSTSEFPSLSMASQKHEKKTKMPPYRKKTLSRKTQKPLETEPSCTTHTHHHHAAKSSEKYWNAQCLYCDMVLDHKNQAKMKLHYGSNHPEQAKRLRINDSAYNLRFEKVKGHWTVKAVPSGAKYEAMCLYGTECRGFKSGACPYNHPDTQLCIANKNGQECGRLKCNRNHTVSYAYKRNCRDEKLKQLPRVHPTYHTMCKKGHKCEGARNGQCGFNHPGQPVCKHEQFTEQNPLHGCHRVDCYANHYWGRHLRVGTMTPE